IDGLHTAAGNKKVYELHGSVYRNYCEDCGKFYSLDETLSKVKKGIPVCDCGGIIKPDVVLYGENLDDGVIDGAIKAISEADTLIIAGTSLAVYPAAGFVGYFKGENLILINKQETPYDKYATLCIHDDIVKISRETAEKL
ncbi:MAG: NAD-dependent protein deacylase, partial [Clostridia bacterium]|nr:NAD-dependent protein deacylase [Clostridia bacterium]